MKEINYIRYIVEGRIRIKYIRFIIRRGYIEGVFIIESEERENIRSKRFIRARRFNLVIYIIPSRVKEEKIIIINIVIIIYVRYGKELRDEEIGNRIGIIIIGIYIKNIEKVSRKERIKGRFRVRIGYLIRISLIEERRYGEESVREWFFIRSGIDIWEIGIKRIRIRRIGFKFGIYYTRRKGREIKKC